MAMGVGIGSYATRWRFNTVVAANFEAAIEKADQLAKLNQSVFNLLASLPIGSNPEIGIEQILRDCITDATLILGKGVNRGYVLQPNETDYLVPLASYQMPQDSLRLTRFYIGKDTVTERGIAGCAYVERELKVVHFNENGQADDERYLVSPNRPRQPYDSFIAIPISTPKKDYIGVLCLDSQYKETFDSDEVQDVLRFVASTIGVVIQIGHKLGAAARRNVVRPGNSRKTPGTRALKSKSDGSGNDVGNPI